MITDLQVQHELLKTALEATDNYLSVEKRARDAGMATNTMVHDFSYFMSQAHEALQTLGVLDQHEPYMEVHVKEMMRLHGSKDQRLAALPYAHVPGADYGEVEEATQVWDKPSPVKNSNRLTPEQKSKAKARARSSDRPYPNMIDNMWAARQEGNILSFGEFLNEEHPTQSISEEEIQSIVDSVEWEDMVDLYNEDELGYEEILQEKLTAQARIKKQQSFSRMRSKRNVARGIKLKRSSSPEVLKKRAMVAARNAVYRRLLRGRDKSTLSAAEKDRLEQQVKMLKSIQTSLVPRLLPKMRAIEQKRLSSNRKGKK